MTDANYGAAPSGKDLLREAWRQLRQVRGLAGLALVSGLSSVVAFCIFFGPGIAWAVSSGDEQMGKVLIPIAVALGAILATLVGTYFEGAIVSAALQQSRGEQTSAGLALAGAGKRFGRLMQWGLMVATVNLVLSLLRDKNNAVGNIAAAAGGLAWSVATYLALPAVVAEDLGPIAAIKRAASLLKQTWGSALRVTARFGMYLLPAILVAIAIVVGGYFVTVGVEVWAGLALMALGILLIIVVAAFSNIVTAYVKTQLYLYAAGHATTLSKELVRNGIQAA